MGKFNLSTEANEANVEQALRMNRLNNNDWISVFLNYIAEIDDSLISIDGVWGSGKTYLAKEMSLLINQKWEMDYKNQIVDITYPGISVKDLSMNSCYSIYYNAWEYDNESNMFFFILSIENAE